MQYSPCGAQYTTYDPRLHSLLFSDRQPGENLNKYRQLGHSVRTAHPTYLTRIIVGCAVRTDNPLPR